MILFTQFLSNTNTKTTISKDMVVIFILSDMFLP